MILGAASITAAIRLPDGHFSAPGLKELVPAAVRLICTGHDFSRLSALGGEWSGREFDFGFAHGIAVQLPDGRRHAVLIPHAMVKDDGPSLAAKAAILQLTTWSANG